MPSVINENTQYVDDAGLPIVNGFIHIGTRNQDPTVLGNKITIYSDRDLTTTLSNPQRTDADGRSVNKIFIPGKYSITVQDSDSVQEYTDLDAGELPGTGVTQLENVQGTNTVIADAVPTITTLVDNQTYVFRAAGANTGAMTLQIDTTAQKSILKQHDVAMVSGDIEANQTVMVVYNATDDVFELISQPTTSSFDSISVSNNITVGGTVDSRDVAADGTTLDAIPTIYHGRIGAATGTGTVAGGSGFTYSWSGAQCTITHSLSAPNHTIIATPTSAGSTGWIANATANTNSDTVRITLYDGTETTGKDFNFILMLD